MKRSFLSLLVFCLCFSFSFSGVQAEVNNGDILKTSTENEIQKEETNITNESSTKEQETVKNESEEKEISSDEPKEYFIVFKDEIIPNIGEKKKEIIKEKKVNWKGLLNSNKVEIIEEFDNFPILIVKMTEKQAEKLSKDKTVDFIIDKKKLDDNTHSQLSSEPDPTTDMDDTNNTIDLSLATLSGTYVESYTNKNYLNDIKAPGLWQQGFKGEGIRISIFDSGINVNNPEISSSIANSKNCTVNPCDDKVQDTDGHGMHIAGIIAGSHKNSGQNFTPQNNFDVKGVAPEASLYPVKVTTNGDDIDTDNVIRGMDWAINQNVHIINMSIFLNTLLNFDEDNLDERLLKAYTDRTTEEHGILIVASAGNVGYEYGENNVKYPARNSNVVAVSNVYRTQEGSYKIYKGAQGNPTKGSATGPSIDLAAPGYRILSSYKTSYGELTGTSQSAPVVSGIAALLKQKYPFIDSRELRLMLRELAHFSTILSGQVYSDGVNHSYEYGYGFSQATLGNPTLQRFWIHNDPIPVKLLPDGMYSHRQIATLTPSTEHSYNIVRVFEKPNSTEKWYEVEYESNKYGWIKKPELSNYTPSSYNISYWTLHYLYDIPNGSSDGSYVTAKNLDVLSQNYDSEFNPTSWVKVRSPFGDKWTSLKPNLAFRNEFMVKLKVPTHLYDDYNSNTSVAYLNTPQDLVAREIVKNNAGRYAFRVYTWLGWKWIQPPYGDENYIVTEYGID